MLSYKDIYERDIKLWYSLKENKSDEEHWEYFRSSYDDPDQYPVSNGKFMYVDDIKCTVDGLLSIKRIKHFEGIGEKFIETFSRYRKTPIISQENVEE